MTELAMPKQKRPNYQYFVKKGKRVIGSAFTQDDLAKLAKMKRSRIEFEFKKSQSFKNIEGYTLSRKPITREEYNRGIKNRVKPKKKKVISKHIKGIAKEKSLFWNTFEEFYTFK